MKRLKMFSLIAALGLMLIPSFSQADINQTMSYQGQLTDSGGNPLNGSYNIRFFLYTALTGGTQVWYEQHTGITVTNGIFNVSLGSVSYPINLAMRDNLFLEIRVYNGSTWETMTPRHSLVAGAYALAARNVVNRQVLTVAHSGGDTTTVSAAIDMLLGQGAYSTALSPAPAIYTQWVIEVKAGTFIEQGTFGASGTIVVPDYVTIRGQGWDATTLRIGQINLAGTGRALEAFKIDGQYDSVTVINMAAATKCHVREVWCESMAPSPIVDMTGASYCQVLDNHFIGYGPLSANGMLMGGLSYSRIENNYIDLANPLVVAMTTGSYGISDGGTATTQSTITKNTIRYVTTGISGTGPSYGIGLAGTSTTTNSSRVSHNVFLRGSITKDVIAVGTGNAPTWTAPGTGAHGINNQGSDGTELTAF